jgi:hypothetical protein
MRHLTIGCLGICVVAVFMASGAGASSLILDAATGMTWGDFSVQDVTVEMESEIGNPAVMGEFRFGSDDWFGLGVGYAQIKNDFTGKWDGSEGKHTEGDITQKKYRPIFTFYTKPALQCPIRVSEFQI